MTAMADEDLIKEETDAGRKPFYGLRLSSTKPARYPDRKPKTGQRFFFEHPDGSFKQNNDEEEEMEMTAEQREQKMKEITETVEKFKRENPEAAAKAEADAAAWQAEQFEIGFPFETAVAKLRGGGMALSEAVRKVAADSPALHDDYLKRVKVGQTRPLV